MQHWHASPVDQWESRSKDWPIHCGQFLSTKMPKQINGEHLFKKCFGMMILSVHTHSNAHPNALLTLYREALLQYPPHTSVWELELGRFLTGGNENLCDLTFGNAFLVMSPKSPAMKEEICKLAFIKMTSLSLQKTGPFNPPSEKCMFYRLVHEK